MFKIKNLDVSIDNKKILKNFNMDINPGELHVIMGPNGSGKSTLTHTIAGKDSYEIEKGDIIYNNKSIIDLDPEERAGQGIFVSFQYPISLPGVNNIYFLIDLLMKAFLVERKKEMRFYNF
jgi:Fe-S cluster assembly ATP-binding protein